jgi:hypothetical protein
MAEGDLAVRIRQDIVVLPDLHAYITQLMTRDRSLELYRYFHIEPPVDRGSVADCCREDEDVISPMPAGLGAV